MMLRKMFLIALVGASLSVFATGCGENTGNKMTEGTDVANIEKDQDSAENAMGTDVANIEKDQDSAENAMGTEAAEDGKKVEAGGEALMESIYGESFTKEDFAAYDLTMVNVFATWCGPCIQEIPELEKISQDMKDDGVNVIGIVLDALQTVDASGKEVYLDSAIETAKKLHDATGSTYMYLKPKALSFGGRLLDVSAVPETFFVDKDGNVVGETYLGSRDYDEWSDIIKKELSAIKGE